MGVRDHGLRIRSEDRKIQRAPSVHAGDDQVCVLLLGEAQSLVGHSSFTHHGLDAAASGALSNQVFQLLQRIDS